MSASAAWGQSGLPADLSRGDTAGAQQQREQQLQRYYEQRQREQTLEQPTDPIIGDEVQPGPAAAQDAAGPTFMLQQVRFSASELLSEEALTKIAQPFVGREVHLGDLNRIVDDVNALYLERGIVTARAVLPQQTIRDGIVDIRLIEGRLGQVEIQGNRRLREGYILKRVQPEPGALVDSNRLKDELVYFNRTHDTQLQAVMRPGDQPGLTDILLLAQEPALTQGSVFVDDAGSDSTGRYRAGLSLRLNDLLGIADRFDLYGTFSDGASNGFVSYNLPVTPWGTRIGLSYSHNEVDIVRGPFQDLDISGEADTLSFNLTQPLVATRRWLVTAAASYSQTDSTTDAADFRISESETQQISGGFTVEKSGDHHRASLTQTLSNVHAEETLEAEDDFLIYDAQLSYLQLFGSSPYSLLFQAGGQYAESDLIPAVSLFQIGGVTSVRGYELGVLSGPRGYYGQLELHRRFGGTLDGFLFVDHGQIYSAFPRNVSISAAGAGFAYFPFSWLNLSADIGVPFDEVTPDQDSVRANFRIALSW